MYINICSSTASCMCTYVCTDHLTDTVEVLYNYNAEQPDELTLRVGDVIKVYRQLRGGWSKGELNGRQGLFHEYFVKKDLIVSIKLAHIKSINILIYTKHSLCNIVHLKN